MTEWYIYDVVVGGLTFYVVTSNGTMIERHDTLNEALEHVQSEYEVGDKLSVEVQL